MESQEGTALVILVPEAETLAQAFRDRYDPSAAEGMPAHITVLYPFKPADAIGKSVVDALQSLFSRHSHFRFSLADVLTWRCLLARHWATLCSTLIQGQENV